MNSFNENKFVEFLYTSKKIPKKQGKFYLMWVNRFLSFYQRDLKTASYKSIKAFLDVLEKEGKQDWQIRQAYRAINIFLKEYIHVDIKHDKSLEVKNNNEITRKWKDAYNVFLNEIRL